MKQKTQFNEQITLGNLLSINLVDLYSIFSLKGVYVNFMEIYIWTVILFITRYFMSSEATNKVIH